MEVTSEVQVDIFHGNNLSVTTAGSTALNAEYRTQRRFSQSYGNLLTDLL